VVAGTETLQHEESDRSGDDSQDGDDEQDDQDMDHMYQYQDEYEEEDRLIAQGGMGIPTDEVGFVSTLVGACGEEVGNASWAFVDGWREECSRVRGKGRLKAGRMDEDERLEEATASPGFLHTAQEA
jgi:hypothetical protein